MRDYAQKILRLITLKGEEHLRAGHYLVEWDPGSGHKLRVADADDYVSMWADWLPHQKSTHASILKALPLSHPRAQIRESADDDMFDMGQRQNDRSPNFGKWK